MIFKVEFKKHMADASIFDIIISKFCYKKNLCLIILFNVHESSKINFYYAILSFSQAVCL